MPVEDGSTALHPVCPAGMQTVMKVKYPELFTLPFHRKSPLLPSVRFLLSRPVFPTFCKCLVILFCLYDI